MCVCGACGEVFFCLQNAHLVSRSSWCSEDISIPHCMVSAPFRNSCFCSISSRTRSRKDCARSRSPVSGRAGSGVLEGVLEVTGRFTWRLRSVPVWIGVRAEDEWEQASELATARCDRTAALLILRLLQGCSRCAREAHEPSPPSSLLCSLLG